MASDQEIAAYAHRLDEGARETGVLIHARVLMTNSVHLLMTPIEEKPISRCIQHVGRYYAFMLFQRFTRCAA
ncbi:MAG: hypothetical protein HN738_20315 [Gammaproteobacteria bacterium]|nr:hypothetical protein [Gammaproteobacteria bacterium]MBT7880429.1 hypothetical protein [Gammaproteobacteria bacterium]MDG1233086.1 transposase [Pseudomonadales bacterium]